MDFLTTYHTDQGIQKNTNQDGLLIKTAKTPHGRIGLFVVCDGMGGLTHGELASSTVIQAMSDWFDNDLPELVATEDDVEVAIRSNLETYLKAVNDHIVSYGHNHSIQIGTTLTALFILYSNYYIVQIGDSRAYSIQNHLEQLTKDQTLVARELDRGVITKEQAKTHPKRNVLLQCIGASKEIDVVITSGKVDPNTTYLLCTDGFYQKITREEIKHHFMPNHLSNKQQMQDSVIELVELAKRRNEVDNISVVLTKVT